MTEVCGVGPGAGGIGAGALGCAVCWVCVRPRLVCMMGLSHHVRVKGLCEIPDSEGGKGPREAFLSATLSHALPRHRSVNHIP